ncbi:hypothetical protein QBC41DRAFT_355727 [Cercophora samala]|uniref:Uncharacterized protein n=1 Tax=Cercophora samala TaxID=330535 RepID=A0AA40DDD8_9PEZI|nr:hypothetical protein QBC41DRAFT_355727 [Cercophora samala]
MSRGHDDSEALEAEALPTMGTMTPPRRGIRPRGPNARGPESIYKIRSDYDPWNSGSTSWTEAGEEKLNRLLGTATRPPIKGFWQSVGPNALKIVTKWFDHHEPLHDKLNDRPIVPTLKALMRDYDRVMGGWIHSLQAGTKLNHQLSKERVKHEKITEKNITLQRENRALQVKADEAESYVVNLEVERDQLSKQNRDLAHDLSGLQGENRTLKQTLKRRTNVQTSPGGTPIKDGRAGHGFSEDIPRKEREEYLARIGQSEERADAAEARVKELEELVSQLRAGQEAINQAGDLTSTASPESKTATAVKATEEKFTGWVKELQGEIEQLKNENQAVKENNGHLQTTIVVLKAKNDETLEKEKDKLRGENEQLRNMLSDQRSEMAGKLQKTTQELKDLQEQYDKLQRRAAELEKKIRRLEVDKDNQINLIRQQVDSFGRASKAYIPQLRKLGQLIDQTEAVLDQHREGVEKAKPILERAGELKKTQNPSPETVSGLADLVSSMHDVFNSPVKDRESHEPVLKEAKETRDTTQQMLKDLEGLNEMLLGWRSRVRSGLGSPTALRHEGDALASSLERLQHQYREQGAAEKAARSKTVSFGPSKELTKSRPPTASFRPNGRMPLKPPPNLTFVDKPDKDAPVAVRGDEKDYKPDPKTPPNKSPGEPQPVEEAPKTPETRKSPKAPRSPESPKSHAEPSPTISQASSAGNTRDLYDTMEFADGFDFHVYWVLEAFIAILEYVTIVTDEDNRKPDNSLFRTLIKKYEPKVKSAVSKILGITGEPPLELLSYNKTDHLLFWPSRAYKEFQYGSFNPNWDEVAGLKTLQECKHELRLQIEGRKGKIEWERYVTNKFKAALEIANRRHEEAKELRTKYSELETELLGTKLSDEEEFYVVSQVKRHLDSGKEATEFEDLVWEIAPVIKREVKLSKITQELEKWVQEYSEWVDKVLKPQYIRPLKEVIRTIKKKIADIDDMDDKLVLQARMKRIKLLISHDHIEELPLKETVKTPLETITTNILVNQDAIETQYDTRRQRIESLIREKVMQLYSVTSHSKHAEAVCFCSLLKYYAPKLYYSVISDGCCGHGQMVTVIEEGTNTETQPVNPEDPSLSSSTTSTRRVRRTCQGHHGHGILSASTTLPTILCHVMTSFLWLILFALSTPADLYTAILAIVTAPFGIALHAFSWVKYGFNYFHWSFFPENYAENYYPKVFVPPAPPPSPPATPVAATGRSRASTASYIPSIDSFSSPFRQFIKKTTRRPSKDDDDDDASSSEFPMRPGRLHLDGAAEENAERAPSVGSVQPIDIFAFKPSPPASVAAPSVAGSEPIRPPPPTRPPSFTFSRNAASPASIIISLSIMTTIFTSLLYLALDQERHIWLSNNHWRRAFVNDMLEPFASLETRGAAWANWGVLAFPVNAAARAVNSFVMKWWPWSWPFLPWDANKALVVGPWGGYGYGEAGWGERAGLRPGTGVSESQAAGF